jgi:hypothetical protein
MDEEATISRLKQILKDLKYLKDDIESPSSLLPANSNRLIIRAMWDLEDLRSSLAQSSETTSKNGNHQTSSPDFLKNQISQKVTDMESIQKKSARLAKEVSLLRPRSREVYQGGQIITNGENVWLKLGPKKVTIESAEPEPSSNKDLPRKKIDQREFLKQAVQSKAHLQKQDGDRLTLVPDGERKRIVENAGKNVKAV